MKFQDYYKTLGISQNASKDEIQRAYRKLARKYHPDVNKDKDAEERILQINEAYQVLKDPEKKKIYDTYGENWQQSGYQQPPGEKGFSQDPEPKKSTRTFRYGGKGNFEETAAFSEFFNNLFGSSGAAGFAQEQYSYDVPGRTQEAEITVSLAEAFHGVTKAISLQSFEVNESGQAQPVMKTLHVKIPEGIINGSVIRLAGQGEKGVGKGRSGDLLLRVFIGPDPRFLVDGHDLYTLVAVSPWEAALGTKITVQTVDTTVNLTIPKLSQAGKKFRIRGKGIPKRKGGSGDIIVELEVRLPDKLSPVEEKMLEELARISTFNPRTKRQQRARSHGKT